MTISGDLRTMTDALGLPVGDPRVLDAMALVGLPVSRSEFQLGSTTRVYYTAEQQQAEFIFEDDALSSVIIHTIAADGHGAYEAPGRLIEGLSGNARRDEVLARFGEPVKSRPDSDRFLVDGVHLRFGYVDDRVSQITPMLKAPGA